MRGLRPCSPAETVDPEPAGPRPGVVALPVPAVASVLDAGKDRQALLDVAVELGEPPRRVAVAKVGAPTPQDVVEVLDHPLDRAAHVAPAGCLPDLGPDLAHRPIRRPPVQVVAPRQRHD